jgi:nicotinamidase-related amidase
MADVTLSVKTTALLLQDLQNELIKGSRPVVPLSGTELIANCQRLLAKSRAVGMPVIYVRVSRRPDLKDAIRSFPGALRAASTSGRRRGGGTSKSPLSGPPIVSR